MITPAPLTAYASTLAARPVTVICAAQRSFTPRVGGYVLASETGIAATIYLPSASCVRLVRILDGRPLKPSIWGHEVQHEYDGAALHNLLHEAMHVRLQSSDEALVERNTCRNAWQAVSPLRFAARLAREMLRTMMDAHLNTSRSPIDYQADGC